MANFNFGAKPVGTVTPSTGGFSFGNTAQNKPTGFGFGAATGQSSAPAAVTTATAAASTGFQFGAAVKPLTLSGLSASVATTSVAAPLAGSGGGFKLGSTTAAAPLTLGAKPAAGGLFGAATATTSTPAFGVGGGLGAATSTAATGQLGGLTGVSGTNLFNTSTAASSTALSLNRGLGGVDATKSAGLGGAANAQTGGSGGTLGAGGGVSQEVKAVKEHALPAEIAATVTEFEAYIKQQKSEREQIARMSSKPIFSVQEEVSSLSRQLASLSTQIARGLSAAHALKADSTAELEHAELAQRTRDTPAGLQHENTAPHAYFSALLAAFHARMRQYRHHIDAAERALAGLGGEGGAVVGAGELGALLKKLHEGMLQLAAQLHATHTQVGAQREHYINYRRAFHGTDASSIGGSGLTADSAAITEYDIFEKRRRRNVDNTLSDVINDDHAGSRRLLDDCISGLSTVPVGPTPFSLQSTVGGVSNLSFNATVTTSTSLSTLGQPPQTGNLSLGGGNTAGTGLFGSGAKQTGFGFGSSSNQSFGFGGASAGVKPAFGPTSAPAASGGAFNLSGPATAGAAPTGGFSFGAGSGSLTAGTSGAGAFQLQKPPIGNKRGKKT